ncbi:MAG: cobyric acid synthase [Nitrospirota bacterium]|nr:cobyric acid synthase [Nitrospirota bacterium]
MSRSLMIQGTGSGVGKSFIVAGLCRIFRDMGIKVAPFKSQNMALNSFVTKEGGEIGRAQVLQAEAAGVEPSVYMNPILLKATGESGAQVILLGKVHSTMKAIDYYKFRKVAWEAVRDAWERMSREYELIVIEGAGSPAEINLVKEEIVNMAVARHTGSPVILVGDIDRGGVFASLYGTVALLDGDADYIKAFIINKFRGDMDILTPGNRLIEEKTGVPVIGVLPYVGDLGLHEEDGLAIERIRPSAGVRPIRITVLRLRYISNFTDFDPFLYEPDVELQYSLREEDILNSDLVIIPGSKNTVRDLLYLRESGIEDLLRNAVSKEIPLIGICGGYQMLGRVIRDPYGVESAEQEVRGLCFLDTETVLDTEKSTFQVMAEGVGIPLIDKGLKGLRGYEIHVGRTPVTSGLFRITRGEGRIIPDGASNGDVWGTYIHGIFDNDSFRRSLINGLRIRKGFEPLDTVIEYAALRDKALDRWADLLRENLDIEFIKRLVS